MTLAWPSPAVPHRHFLPDPEFPIKCSALKPGESSLLKETTWSNRTSGILPNQSRLNLKTFTRPPGSLKSGKRRTYFTIRPLNPSKEREPKQRFCESLLQELRECCERFRYGRIYFHLSKAKAQRLFVRGARRTFDSFDSKERLHQIRHVINIKGSTEERRLMSAKADS